MQDAIVETLAAIELFAQGIHADGKFRQVVVCGIGGSALGPMLVADALDGPNARMSIHVLDNTDPAGVDRLLARLGDLTETLILTISKSGTTPEPRNCMLEMQRAAPEMQQAEPEMQEVQKAAPEMQLGAPEMQEMKHAASEMQQAAQQRASRSQQLQLAASTTAGIYQTAAKAATTPDQP